jgi:structural maintenance of chromosome 4
MAELKTAIQGKQKELDKLKSSSSNIDEEIKELQEKIMEVGGVRLRSQKSKVDGIQDQIDLANKNITSIQCEKATRERNLNKISKSIESKQNELQQLEEELEEIETRSAEVKELAVTVREKVKNSKSVCHY